MSNCETFSLPELCLEVHQVREVLRCVLHTILFTRSLGPTNPKDVCSELFDVTYATCGDPEVETLLEAKISEFCAWIERNPGQLFHLMLGFYERRKRPSTWLPRPGERMFWEQWCVAVRVSNNAALQSVGEDGREVEESQGEAGGKLGDTREQVEECIRFVVEKVNETKDHIPAVSSTNTVSFPFDVWIPSDGKLSLGFGLMKKVLMQTCPPPMLG